jgi:hydroxymethylglutaryl-CoA lyase
MREEFSNLWRLPPEVTVVEQIVGEGFAAEPNFIPTEAKVWLVRELINAGCKNFQVSNFGNPKIMPQFRDCEDLYRRIGLPEGVSLQSPTLNMRAIQRVVELKKSGCGPDKAELLIATTDVFNEANVGKTTEEQWKLIEPMVKAAKDAGLKIIGGIGGCWTCLETGEEVPIEVVMEFANRWVSLGADQITHCEGTMQGQPAPNKVYDYFSRMLDIYPDPKFHVFHLHEAYGWGVPCCVAAMQAGMTNFEVCLGGLQGGPELTMMDRIPIVSSQVEPPTDLKLAPAMGLVCTEDFVSICEAMGVKTGFDVGKLLNIGRWLEHIVGRRLKSTRLRWR